MSSFHSYFFSLGCVLPAPFYGVCCVKDSFGNFSWASSRTVNSYHPDLGDTITPVTHTGRLQLDSVPFSVRTEMTIDSLDISTPDRIDLSQQKENVGGLYLGRGGVIHLGGFSFFCEPNSCLGLAMQNSVLSVAEDSSVEVLDGSKLLLSNENMLSISLKRRNFTVNGCFQYGGSLEIPDLSSSLLKGCASFSPSV